MNAKHKALEKAKRGKEAIYGSGFDKGRAVQGGEKLNKGKK